MNDQLWNGEVRMMNEMAYYLCREFGWTPSEMVKLNGEEIGLLVSIMVNGEWSTNGE